ncbi:MAG: DNA-binding protein WhiA [Anaerovibrio sp.]|uniref:DNA-binding protein WhiA n=1 Tax=Anaerovibrio sp. TaxID=1872532 RepID=UPI0025EEC472|nr:DNA-binding protein WhiA [Anaerovibrio sp.]MCR5176625.1 DNA-binding protein WhiA [Anaerovibrio sp.]
MPSFAADVKNELAHRLDRKKCCQTAELAALLRMGASMTLGPNMMLGLNFVTENAAVARKTLTLLKSISDVQTEVTVSRSRRLKKNNRYMLRVVPSPQVRPFMEKMGMLGETGGSVGRDTALLKKSCCRHAYLRGAFMGGGSVNRPEAECHLELMTGNYGFADTIYTVLKRMAFPAGFTDRKNHYIIYIKDGEAIMDFLSIIGAHKALEEFEGGRNLKEVRNQVNRLVNCETANLQKTVDAAAYQNECIKLIENSGRMDGLSTALQKTAQCRRQHPDATLAELAEMLLVSKSCVNHRLRKLVTLAENFKKTEDKGEKLE